MKILIDTREPGEGTNHPWQPFFPADVTVVRGTLETGDVALAALPDGAVCERKTATDFLAAIGRERKRFDLEVKRARYCGSFTIIVEASLSDVMCANHARGQLTEAHILGAVAAWSRRGAPVLFAGSPRSAALLAYRILAGQISDVQRAAKAISKTEASTNP